MKIAIIGGTGQEAHGMVLRLAAAGEEVIIGSRAQAKAEQRARELNEELDRPTIRGEENSLAAREGELIVVTVPYSGHIATLSSLVEALKGKIVIDTTVPLDTANFRQLARNSDLSAAEEAQQILGHDTRVVAAFQNISAHVLHDPKADIDCDVLVCGDDRYAKTAAIELIGRIGMRGLDAGPLKMARVVEDITPLLISLNRRYKSKEAGIRITGITV